MSDERIDAIEAKIDGLRQSLEPKLRAVLNRVEGETDSLLVSLARNKHSTWIVLGFLAFAIVGWLHPFGG